MLPTGVPAASGLSGTAAARLLAEHGPNTVATPHRPGVVRRAARQLVDPMLLLLVAAGALTTWQGDVADTAVIATVLVLNTAVGVAQELRAERAVTALRSMAAPRARVRRDGTTRTVPAAELVPGDLVVLEAGDVVPADARLVEAHGLAADESAVTGESLAVARREGDAVRGGTTLTRGRGVAVVTATGAASTLGVVAALVAGARPGPTPLQRRLATLARQLTVAAVAAGVLVLVLALARGLPWEDAALQAASLAVAAVPESLPAVLTLSLALGARRMARHAAIARELRAVETLGSVTLLATDKTGTLTENRLVVVAAWTPAGEHTVSGVGYEPAGSVDGPVDADAVARLRELGRDAVLCSDAELELRGGEWLPVGDPTEAALVAFATRAGVEATAVRRAFPRVHEVPFDSDRGWMLTAHRGAEDAFTVVKGGPDRLLPRMSPTDRSRAAAAWCLEHAATGHRVLLVARTSPTASAATHLPDELELVGAVAMADPPRSDVHEVMAALREAGIRLAVMTGDQPATAQRIAEQVGLVGGVADAASGDLDDTSTVFARVRPADKLTLVRRWQQAGEVVAVTGDGVNDGPALRQADIGVAMGRGGTEVARQAADLVLTDDRLMTVVRAVQEGRRIQDNLRRFLGYALAGGLAEVLFVLTAPFFGFLVPLLPGQILWINMLTHGLPGVAMGAEPASPGTLRRRPLAPDAPVLDRTLLTRVAGTGVLIALATLGAAVVARRSGDDARTAAFLTLGLAQLGTALASRDPGAARRGAFLTAAVAVAAVLQVAGAFAPLADVLRTGHLGFGAWLVCLVLAMVPGAALAAVRHRSAQDLGPWPGRTRTLHPRHRR